MYINFKKKCSILDFYFDKNILAVFDPRSTDPQIINEIEYY